MEGVIFNTACKKHELQCIHLQADEVLSNHQDMHVYMCIYSHKSQYTHVFNL